MMISDADKADAAVLKTCGVLCCYVGMAFAEASVCQLAGLNSARSTEIDNAFELLKKCCGALGYDMVKRQPHAAHDEGHDDDK